MGGLTRTLAAARTRLKPAERPWDEPARHPPGADRHRGDLPRRWSWCCRWPWCSTEALRKGIGAYLEGIGSDDTLAAIRLTLLVAAIAVPLNTVFGVAAAWAIAKFEFPGKSLLTTLIDLPFSVSPVISGLVCVLLFGAHGWFGPFAEAHGIQSSSPSRAWCWPPSSSPSPSWPAS